MNKASYEAERDEMIQTPTLVTVDQIKTDLPDVKVSWDNKPYIGMVRGRRNKFATLLIQSTGASFQVSWETLARCINENKQKIISKIKILISLL